MALQSAILGLDTEAGNSGTLDADSSSAIPITPGRQFALNANADINVRFSNSATTGVTAAVSTDFRIPENQIITFTVPYEVNQMFIYSTSTSATYYWAYLSKF